MSTITRREILCEIGYTGGRVKMTLGPDEAFAEIWKKDGLWAWGVMSADDTTILGEGRSTTKAGARSAVLAVAVPA